MKKLTSRLEVLKIDDIDPGERARKDYKDVGLLGESIKRHGLINPICVESPHPTAGDEKYLLLAGGRRLAAHKYLKRDSIACNIFEGPLSDIERKTVELIENLDREDLEYHEKIALEKQIYDLQVEIHGKKGVGYKEDGVSIRDVAGLIGISHTKLAEDLKLCGAMAALPDIDWKGLKNRNEAMKLHKNVGRVVMQHEEAKEAAITLEVSDNSKYKQNLVNSYIIGDFFEKIKEIPDGTFSLIEIDPPYAISLGSVKKSDTKTQRYHYGENGYNEVKRENYEVFITDVFRECFRVAKEDAWLICWFASDPWFQHIANWIRKAGFEMRATPGIWVKGEEDEVSGIIESAAGQTNAPGLHLPSCFEMFFYARKGRPSIVKQGRSNVYGFKPVPPQKKFHPTERPMELMEEIITTFANPNSRVLVPFAGSGNTLLAAAKQKMLPIGFDLSGIFKDGYVIKIKEMF